MLVCFKTVEQSFIKREMKPKREELEYIAEEKACLE